jgi:hypothetical protein
MSAAEARMQIAPAVTTLVEMVPTMVLKTHGSPQALKEKILDIICTDPIPEETPTAPKKRGRPKGSKNKNKNETDHPIDVVQVEKRGRGRPKGSKNKPKTDSPTDEVPVEKRGRGRPKGSKNKNKTDSPTEEVPVQKRPRGRPEGSGSPIKCSVCLDFGHNKRTCPCLNC